MGAGWALNRKCAVRNGCQAGRKMTPATPFDLFQATPLANAARHFMISVLGRNMSARNGDYKRVLDSQPTSVGHSYQSSGG